MRITRILAQGFLAGKSALVTGSTSGIGESVAKALASKGANVVINGFGDPNAINALVESIKKDYNVGATFIGGDLTKQSEVKALHDESVKAFPGGIDILVNNAGFQHVSPIEDFPLDIFEKMLAVMAASRWRKLPSTRQRVIAGLSLQAKCLMSLTSCLSIQVVSLPF